MARADFWIARKEETGKRRTGSIGRRIVDVKAGDGDDLIVRRKEPIGVGGSRMVELDVDLDERAFAEDVSLRAGGLQASVTREEFLDLFARKTGFDVASFGEGLFDDGAARRRLCLLRGSYGSTNEQSHEK
jgi:hypothetical protein